MQLEFLEYGKNVDPGTPGDEQESKQLSDFVAFRMTNVDNAFANGLRRILLAEIPTLAFTIIQMSVNTSVLHDEFITNRIGLIPILSKYEDFETMPMPQECCGKEYLERGSVSYMMGCDKCSLRCTFDVRCPEGEESFDFTSDHILSTDERIKLAVGEGSKIFLAKLGRGQHIKGVAYAKKGIAKQHARHMAVGTVAYRYEAEINLNQTGLSDLSEEQRRLWVSRCPAKVFSLDDNVVTIPRKDACIMCRECLSTEAPFDKLPAPLVSVRNKRDTQGRFTVVMNVESVGNMAAHELVRVAMIIMKKKLESVQIGLEAARGGGAGSLLSADAGVRRNQGGGGGGGGTGGSATAAASGGAVGSQQHPVAQSSVVVGGNLLESEQNLLQMAENDPSLW